MLANITDKLLETDDTYLHACVARREHLHNNSTVPRSSYVHFAARTLYIRLLGINLLTFDIGEIEEGEFFVKFKNQEQR